MARVLRDGAIIAVAGIAVGLLSGFSLARIAGAWFDGVRTPGLLPVAAAALVLIAAAILASAMPAARASRIDVIQALRAD
jgi:ABC-type antimicrobial peptide transport system permease subunit